MSTYSAGLLNVSSLTANGSSATLTANTVTATNLTTTNINATNFSLNNNLTVSGDVTFNGLNFYEGNLKVGSVISYILRTTVPIALSNAFFVGNGLPASATYNLKVYEVIYWGYDTRSSSLTRMSATVCVPTSIYNNKTLFCYKHQTLTTTSNDCTLWNYMSIFVNTLASPTFYMDINGWITSAISGYVSIIADNPSFGASIGTYNYLDPNGEPQSQYNALLATKELIGLHPELFGNSFVGVNKYNIVVGGYSLGALVSGQIAQLINQNPLNNLNVINIIAGAPPNSLGQNMLVLSNNNLPTSWIIAYFFMMNFIGNPFYQKFLLPNIYNDVLPIFNALRLPNGFYTIANPFSLIVEFINVAAKSIVSSPNTNPAHYPDVSGNPTATGYVYLDTLIDTSGFSVYVKSSQLTQFYTNPFINYTDLSGVPINIMYSAADELCNYNPSSPNLVVDTSSNAFDNVHNYFKGWVIDSSFNDVFGNQTSPPLSSLKRNNSSFSENTNLVINLANQYDPNMLAMIGSWVASENTNNCTNNRINIGTTFNHTFTSAIYGLYVANYLKFRGTN